MVRIFQSYLQVCKFGSRCKFGLRWNFLLDWPQAKVLKRLFHHASFIFMLRVIYFHNQPIPLWHKTFSTFDLGSNIQHWMILSQEHFKLKVNLSFSTGTRQSRLVSSMFHLEVVCHCIVVFNAPKFQFSLAAKMMKLGRSFPP